MQPGIPLRQLDTQAENANRALEDGADTVTIIDEPDRVDPIGAHAPASEMKSAASRLRISPVTQASDCGDAGFG